MFIKKDNEELPILFERGINNDGKIYCKISNLQTNTNIDAQIVFMYHDPDFWFFAPIIEIETELKRILENFKRIIPYEKVVIGGV